MNSLFWFREPQHISQGETLKSKFIKSYFRDEAKRQSHMGTI